MPEPLAKSGEFGSSCLLLRVFLRLNGQVFGQKSLCGRDYVEQMALKASILVLWLP